MDLWTVCPEPTCGEVIFLGRNQLEAQCPSCRRIYTALKLREPFQRQFDEGPLLEPKERGIQSEGYNNA